MDYMIILWDGGFKMCLRTQAVSLATTDIPVIKQKPNSNMINMNALIPIHK